MKTKTAGSTAGTEMPDFNKVDFTSDHWTGKITLEIIFGQFRYFWIKMIWMMTKGRKLLESTDLITYDNWVELEERTRNLHITFGRHQRTIAVLYVMVFKKGVDSLLKLVQADPCAHDFSRAEFQTYRKWFYYLVQLTRPEAPLGIRSHYCRLEESRELIESLIPIARGLKERAMMDQIAYNRFPADAEAIQMLKGRYPDVPSTPNHPC